MWRIACELNGEWTDKNQDTHMWQEKMAAAVTVYGARSSLTVSVKGNLKAISI